MFCNCLNGKWTWKRIDMCVCVPESICCTTEASIVTNIVNQLYSNIKSFLIKNKHSSHTQKKNCLNITSKKHIQIYVIMQVKLTYVLRFRIGEPFYQHNSWLHFENPIYLGVSKAHLWTYKKSLSFELVVLKQRMPELEGMNLGFVYCSRSLISLKYM